MTDEELEALLPGKSIAQLSPEQRDYLTARLVPAPEDTFTDEQRQLLKDWYLDVSRRLAEFETLNIQPDRRASYRVTSNGRYLLPAFLLTDYGPDETWFFLRELLVTLPFVKAPASEFPAPISPILP